MEKLNQLGFAGPIYKKGDRTKPENYRPISVTSVPCKLMKRIIRDQIVEHMSRNDFFSPFQHGFVSGKSCMTQLLEFLDDITESLDQGDDIDIIYLESALVRPSTKKPIRN